MGIGAKDDILPVAGECDVTEPEGVRVTTSDQTYSLLRDRLDCKFGTSRSVYHPFAPTVKKPRSVQKLASTGWRAESRLSRMLAAGISIHVFGWPNVLNGLWMAQIARNLTDVVVDFFTGKRYLIHDRNPLYTKEFLGIVAGSGIKAIKLPPRLANLNAYAERFVRTIKESCLDQMIFFGEDMLRNAIRE